MLSSIPPPDPVSSPYFDRDSPNLPLSAAFIAANEPWLHAALEPFAQHEGDWDVLLTVEALVDSPEEAAEALRLEFETLLDRWGWAHGLGTGEGRWLRNDWEGRNWLIQAVSQPHQQLCSGLYQVLYDGTKEAGVRFACNLVQDADVPGLPIIIRPDILISALDLNNETQVVGAVEVAYSQDEQSLKTRKAELFGLVPTLRHLMIFDIDYRNQSYFGTSDRPLRPHEVVVAIQVSSFERTDNPPFYRQAPLPTPFTYSYPSSTAAEIPPGHVPLAAFTTLDALLSRYADPSSDHTVLRYTAESFPLATVTLSSTHLDQVFRRVGYESVKFKTGWKAPHDHGRAPAPAPPAPPAAAPIAPTPPAVAQPAAPLAAAAPGPVRAPPFPAPPAAAPPAAPPVAALHMPVPAPPARPLLAPRSRSTGLRSRQKLFCARAFDWAGREPR
ncbi:hypothetical protein JCM10213_007012 [Rhodosporidiobolus nylandii]